MSSTEIDFLIKANAGPQVVRREVFSSMSRVSYSQITKEIGKVIRHRRLENHWSYAALATKIEENGGEVSAKTCENIEKGVTEYSLENLYWIADALNLTLTEMLAYTVTNEVNKAHTLVNKIMKRSEEHRRHLLQSLEFLDTH